MSPHAFFLRMGEALRGAAMVQDTTDGGTFDLDPQSAFQYCVVTSAGAEDRYLPSALKMQVGCVVLVIIDTVTTSVDLYDGTPGSFGSIQYTADGSFQVAVVVSDDGVKEWHFPISG